MLRSHHHLRRFVKLVLWNVYCVNGCGSFRLGYVGVGFGGNCDCRYGILYAPRCKLFVPSTVMQLNRGQSIRLSAAFTLRVHFGEILCELSAF